ncbi:MAG: hypothetical protein ACFFCO_11460 [Promethearchaeota archaeon]
MSSTEHTLFTSVDSREVEGLKRSYAALKGWIKRKHIHVLDQHQFGAHPVEYQDRLMLRRVWFKSPGGIDDMDLVRRYLETKARLKVLGEI